MANVRIFKGSMTGFKTEQIANFSLALTVAFELLEEYRIEKKGKESETLLSFKDLIIFFRRSELQPSNNARYRRRAVQLQRGIREVQLGQLAVYECSSLHVPDWEGSVRCSRGEVDGLCKPW